MSYSFLSVSPLGELNTRPSSLQASIQAQIEERAVRAAAASAQASPGDRPCLRCVQPNQLYCSTPGFRQQGSDMSGLDAVKALPLSIRSATAAPAPAPALRSMTESAVSAAGK